eukprot:1260280-Pleurochrysis_carterae.AAC.4
MDGFEAAGLCVKDHTAIRTAAGWCGRGGDRRRAHRLCLAAERNDLGAGRHRVPCTYAVPTPDIVVPAASSQAEVPGSERNQRMTN